MSWRVLPNLHSGDCAWISAAQLLGWQGDEYENMMRLRRECADDVRKMPTDQLAFAAYTYSAAYEDTTTRHEVKWMAPFVGKNLTEEVVDGSFRKAIARAIETPGNTFWGDHFTLELISNRYKILFLTVRSNTNNITIMPSRFSDTFDGDLTDVRVGFLLAQDTTAFDAICYMSRSNDCIASITLKDLDENEELAKVVYAVLLRPKQDVRFPMPLRQLLSQSRFRRELPSRNKSTDLDDLTERMAAIDLKSSKMSDIKRVRNPETKRCIVVNGPTWRKHRQMYGDRVLSYEVC